MKEFKKPVQNQPVKKDEKKPYQTPELSKHGKVESLTQGVGNGGCSHPFCGPPKGT